MSDQEFAKLVRERWGDLLAEIGESGLQRYASGTPIPRRHFAMAGQAGLQGFPLPPAVGGAGRDAFSWGMVLEQVGYLCDDPAFPLLLSINTGVAELLYRAGRDDLTERYVKPISQGARTASLAFSEGTDLFSMRTLLTTSRAGYRLTGAKEFVTGGLISDLFLTYATGEHGDLVTCLVEIGDEGVRVDRATGVGFATAGTATLHFDDVPLPAERLVVPADGLSNAQQYLNSRRLSICAYTVGHMQALFERAVTRLREVVRYGRPVSELPNVQAAMGRMYISVETSRAIFRRALTRAAWGEADPIFDPVIAAAKHHIGERALALLDEAFRVLGGHAYYGDPRYGMYLREFAGFFAGAGTQDLLEINLGVCTGGSPSNSTKERERRP